MIMPMPDHTDGFPYLIDWTDEEEDE